MRASYAKQRECEQSAHSYGGELAIPEVVLSPVLEELAPSTTLADHDCVAYAVDDGLDSRNACHPSVEGIEGTEAPAREPEEHIIAHAKDPDEWEIGE